MSERRPIASRDTKFAARIAQKLVGLGIAPNRISQASIAFGAMAGAGFWLSSVSDGMVYAICLAIAALGCQLRLLCNLFDGMVAVEGGRGAPDGAFWNEAPDRAADVFILVGLGLGAGNPALGWAASAFAIGTAYIRELGSAQGISADFRGPMAKQHRMATATAAALIAVPVPSILVWPVLSIALWIIVFGSAVTIFRRSAGLIASLKSNQQNLDKSAE